MLLPAFYTLLFLAVSLPLVAGPLRRRKAPVAIGVGVSSAPDVVDYKATLLALRDLEFDHELGAVDDGDYALLRERLMGQAASALQITQEQERDAAAEHIEAAVRALRQPTQAKHSANRTRYCPQCGGVVSAGDRFCTSCGTSLL